MLARRDYGTRGSERDKQPRRFGRATATIYRRGDIENSSWFFRLYLKEEKRHYRKSLKTTDRKEAFDLAHDEILAILAKVQTGDQFLLLRSRIYFVATSCTFRLRWNPGNSLKQLCG